MSLSRALALAGALALLTSGCKPACPEYWEPACALCGSESEACTHAKEIGATLSGKDAECTATSESFDKKKNDEVFARRYCNSAERTSPADSATLTAGPWICGGVRIVFGTRTFRHGSELHEMRALGVASFELTSGPAYDRRGHDGQLVCRYDLGPQHWSGDEVALALDCPDGVGLPTEWAKCLREG